MTRSSNRERWVESSMRQDLEQQLDTANSLIGTLTTELKKLSEGKKQQILTVDRDELDEINSRIQEAQQDLEDALLRREALEKRVKGLKEKEPEAAKIRDQITEQEWPAIVIEYEKLRKLQQEYRIIFDNIQKRNVQIAAFCRRYDALTEDVLDTPQLDLPLECLRFYGIQLGEIPSIREIYTSSEHDEKRIQREEELQRVQEKRARIAEEHAPPCPECEKPMILERDVGRLGETRTRRGTSEWRFTHCKTNFTVEIPETVAPAVMPSA